MRQIEIIAEAGVNHNGSTELAARLIDAAAATGADAVKFQVFRTRECISRRAERARYQIETIGEGSQYDMVRALEISEDDWFPLVERCRVAGIEFLASPFDLASVDFLVKQLGVRLIKIASGEITNGPLLLAAARTGKPVIVSTGMSTLGDIETALGVLAFGYCSPSDAPSEEAFRSAYASQEARKILAEKVTLLHCTTEYPAPLEEVNLGVLATLRSAFDLPVGYSDHTVGIEIPIAAAALGSVVIEKHFTVDRELPGPDHRASLTPTELRAMVEGIRNVERALGAGVKVPSPREQENAAIARRSLVARCPIGRGESFTEENLTTKRPGGGVSPMRFWEYIGTQATRDYDEDELII